MRLFAVTIIALALAAVSVIAWDDVGDYTQQEGEMAYDETAVDAPFDMSELGMQDLNEYNVMLQAEEELLTKMMEVYANDPETLMKLLDILEEPFKEQGVKGSCSTSGHSVTCTAKVEFKIVFKKIKLSVSITGEFIPSDIALRMSIKFNGKTVYSKTISARNPPSMCAPVPYTGGKAKGCLKISDIAVNGKNLSACFTVEARLLNKKVASKKLKCVTLKG